MISDMTVRGAPAIAITGALALAVELHERSFDSTDAAVAFIHSTMDFLVTSRPTAVNLHIAAERIKRHATATASSTLPSASSVVASTIALCESMLAEDVAANKAMGEYGRQVLKQRTGKSKGLRVLTHCNTGSLATAAWGTALGVIRSLFAAGEIEHVYCCETRPYNQGARLTAFELVYEGIPATLICDSAAASFMASGKIDAVVVGADRIVANGDTANKVGTYSHAVNAAYHQVPFFVAAPNTTLDPDHDTGAEIVIEERPSTEITHERSGAQLAPNGIGVANPSFDVTPHDLITDIITETGLIPRLSASPSVFDVRGHLGQAASAKASTASFHTAPGYYDLDEVKVVAYVQHRPHLCARVGESTSSGTWKVREVGDGNINFVYLVEGPLGGIAVKQARPYIRIIGESWPLTQERLAYEARAMQKHHALCPQHVVEVYEYDPTMSVMSMQLVAPPHDILRVSLNRGKIFPDFLTHCATFLGTALVGTSLLRLDSKAFAEQVAAFANTDLCRLTEQVVFTDPYCAAKANRHTTPQLDATVVSIRNDAPLKAAVLGLKKIFVERKEVLVHGDLHTGSFMTAPGSTLVLDAEFAFVGPMAFDVGAVLGNLLIAYYASVGLQAQDSSGSGTDWEGQRTWLLGCVAGLWDMILAVVRTHASSYAGDLAPPAWGSWDTSTSPSIPFFQHTWREAVGFAGCKMLRRVVGGAHVADLEDITDPDRRADCEEKVLTLARAMIIGSGEGRFEAGSALAEAAARVAETGKV